MAMTVLNNASAQFAIGVLNRNSTALGKALRKVSTGQKLNAAADDASAYSISEQMRSKIRSLEQGVRNVQNGSAMLKIASGGIENIVEELRELKELAIDAANDSNTDDDRRIMQKIFDQKKDNINDIATATNYNSKRLLDGSYFSPRNIPTTKAASGSVVNGAFVNGVSGMFSLPTETMNKTGAQEWATGRTAYRHTYRDGDIALNFGSVTLDGELISFPYDLDQQGFTILCTTVDCRSYFGFKFDAGMDVGTGTADGDYDAPFYTIGIRGAKNSAEVAKAFFDGLVSALDLDPETVNDTITLNSVHALFVNRSGDQYSFNQGDANFWIFEGYVESYAPADDYLLDIGGGHDKDWNAFTVHYGEHSNQSTNFYIKDMHTGSLGINVASVTTRDIAKAALDVINSAITYALNEATNVGASLARLEYTENNVATQVENVQASESAIRDADMAKEMTEYTRQNVLTQASQAMLAQANQNSSSVLGLLQ